MRNEAFHTLLAEIGRLHDSKNHDYATDADPYSNFTEAAQTAAGFTGIDAVYATMIGIKLARLRQLTSSGKTPNHESLSDTRRDLATYALLWAAHSERDRPVLAGFNTNASWTQRQTTLRGGYDFASDKRVSYDDKRGPDLTPCRCGRLYTHPEACDNAERCLALEHPHAKPVKR